MPRIFLSPSTQEYNPYITGNGSEEYFMNQIADAMEPYLLANTIRFTRNTPDMTAASSIRLANSGSYDFYLALHSNGSTDGTKEGAVRGVIAFYYPTSANGRRAADIFVKNLKDIYPLPDKVYARATTTLGEVRQPYMPSVLLELGYHDNTADARWIEDNIRPAFRHTHNTLAGHGADAGRRSAEPSCGPWRPGRGSHTLAQRCKAHCLRSLPGMVYGGVSGPSGLRLRRFHSVTQQIRCLA